MSIISLTPTAVHAGWTSVALLLICLPFAACAHGSWSTGYYRQADAAAMPPSEVHFAALTHVVHAHVAPKDDGGVETDASDLTLDVCAALVSAAHRCRVKALLDVSNTWPPGTEFIGDADMSLSPHRVPLRGQVCGRPAVFEVLVEDDGGIFPDADVARVAGIDPGVALRKCRWGAGRIARRREREQQTRDE